MTKDRPPTETDADRKAREFGEFMDDERRRKANEAAQHQRAATSQAAPTRARGIVAERRRIEAVVARYEADCDAKGFAAHGLRDRANNLRAHIATIERTAKIHARLGAGDDAPTIADEVVELREDLARASAAADAADDTLRLALALRDKVRNAFDDWLAEHPDARRRALDGRAQTTLAAPSPAPSPTGGAR